MLHAHETQLRVRGIVAGVPPEQERGIVVAAASLPYARLRSRRRAVTHTPAMLPVAGWRVECTMSQNSLISSHVLTPRWTHAIDVRAESRREDAVSLMAVGLSLLAILRDQAVPMSPVPLADLPRRVPQRPNASTPPKGPTPLSVPQEIESVPEQQIESPCVANGHSAEY